MDRSTGRLFYVILSGMILIALIIYSAPAVAAGPSPKGTVAPAMPSEEPPPTNTPMPSPTPTGIPSYFSNPGGPSCVGGGCTLPSGYNVVISAVRNEQSLQAYDPKTGSVFGTGRVETTILVSGAGIGTVSVYYGLSGVSCSGGHSVDIAKRSGNETHLNVPLSGYVDVTLDSRDFGEFTIYTRCRTAGSYVGNFGISSVWYSLIDVATPTPTAAPTSTPSLTPTTIPTTPPPSSNYDRVVAVNYADQWAHEPRPTNYPNFGVDADGENCNDCTNYLSQVLETGGIPQIQGWDDKYHWFAYLDNDSWEVSKSWAATDWLNMHVSQFQGTRYEYYPNGPANLSAGDFFLMDLITNPFIESPDHARVIVGMGTVMEGDYIGAWMLLASQHCVDRQRVHWAYNLPDGTSVWAWHVIY